MLCLSMLPFVTQSIMNDNDAIPLPSRFDANRIHALGYSNGRSPPRVHERSKLQYPRPEGSANGSIIVGTSDLLYFEDESHLFDDDQEDFSYSMTDPSGKYCFDVNPKRHRKSERNTTNRGNHLFVAHYVNDASFADFSPIVTAAKELQKRQQARDDSGGADFAMEAEILDVDADRCAVRYLETSVLDPDDSFNVVMCGFGPPPLMGYITIRPVARGEEFLASYGLAYWLGKAFADETNEVFEASEDALTTRIAGTCKAAEDRIQAALDLGDRAVRNEHDAQTRLIRETLAGLRRNNRSPWWKQRWKE